jgi:hypothetical protein
MSTRPRTGANLWLAAALSYSAQLISAGVEPYHFLLALCTLFILWLIQARRFGFWDPAAVYVAMSSLYALSPILEVAILGNVLDFDAGRVTFLADASVGYLLAAGIAIAVLRRKPTHAASASIVPSRLALELQTVALICVALYLIYITMIATRYGISIGGIGRAELYADRFVALSITRQVLSIALIYAFALITAARAARLEPLRPVFVWVCTTAALFAASDLLILGDRRVALTTFLAVAPLTLARRIRPLQVFGLALAAVMLLFYSAVRNTPVSDWGSRLDGVNLLVKLSPAAAEFGVVATIVSSIEDLDEFPKDFPSYADAALQLVPRAILPDRPDAPSEWFAWRYYPDYAATGGSFAFSSVVEAVGNLGLIGVPLVGFALGACLVAVMRWRILSAPVGVAFATFVFVFSMRMELASVLRNALFVLSALAILTGVGSVLWFFRMRSARLGSAAAEALS